MASKNYTPVHNYTQVMMDHFVKVAKNSSQYFHIPVDNKKSSEKSQI